VVSHGGSPIAEVTLRRSSREYPEVDPGTRDHWREWLARHHATSDGIWLVIYKKNAGAGRLSNAEAVEEALCFGWIDGGLDPLDERRFRLFVCPRRPGSVWSRINKARVGRLTRAGRMTAAGLARVRAAKKDGSWNLLDSIDRLTVPDDLAAALRADRGAQRNFNAFSDSSKRVILFWILSAKRPETRARRIAETVRLAARNRKAAHGPAERNSRGS
jgi:uncharacterized protein YdeI (YjbR/CyaY-like superfamily)